MPRQVAPPPSGEFEVRLTKPFKGEPTRTIEVIGEPNRPASVHVSEFTGPHKSSMKTGNMSKDDVNELMSLVNQLRGFPSHPSDDIYGLNIRLEFNTFEIQWSNEDDDSVADTLESETKQTFKDVADSIESLGRTFAKKDAAV